MRRSGWPDITTPGLLLCCFCSLLGSGCAALPGGGYVADAAALYQAESINRQSYQISDSVDRHLLSPVARGYRSITPDWVERGILNIIPNLRTVSSAANGLLQGKPGAAATDLSRVLINSPVRLGVFFDVATRWNLRYQEEDFGQTLAVWGYTQSRFIYIPFMGPATVRDLPSLVLRSYLPRLILGHEYHIAISAVDLISVRADLLTATDVRDVSALDPYAFTRDAYYQRRRYLINDGELGEDLFFDEFSDEVADEADELDKSDPADKASSTAVSPDADDLQP